MLSIDIKHPDVMQFIKIKRDLTQVTGANISIKLNKEFMEAVKADEDYILRFPCDLDISKYKDSRPFTYDELYPFQGTIGKGGYYKIIKAREYWKEIIKSAHNVAEPGLMFWDTMVDYSPDGVYPEFKQVTTNPCSEIAMQEYDACRLMAHNLFFYVKDAFKEEVSFDFNSFYEANYEAMRLSDDIIDLELEHIGRILEKIESDPEPEEVKRTERELWLKVKQTAEASRRTGLGITGLADTIAALGLKYDSEEALEFTKNLMRTKMGSELDCTTDLAILRGAFKGWNPLLENNDFYDFIAKEFPDQFNKMLQHGRRNVSWSTIAPTGSLSIMAKLGKYNNISSGMEPIFMPYYMRRKKVDKSDKTARVDFTDQNGDTWQEYPVIMAGFKEWLELYWNDIVCGMKTVEELTGEDLKIAFKLSPYYGSTASEIDWKQRVKMQAVLQQYITHSISSTINLPEDVSEEKVSEIYLEAYKQGLKGITVYRDGSRSGVLVDSSKEVKTDFEYKDAIKRPKELPAELHVTGGILGRFTIIVGLLNNKPYEVFGYDYTQEDGKTRKGILTKKGKGQYFFDKESVSMEMSDEQAAITRLVSTSLRHGADIKFIVEQLNKCEGDLFSFTKSLARILKKYIPEGAKSTVHCQDCGSENVIFQEGCSSCQDCGSSKCG
jgi:ribonucleoside-diphosphate reductase alpha chain